jgi:hypothetical protein
VKAWAIITKRGVIKHESGMVFTYDSKQVALDDLDVEEGETIDRVEVTLTKKKED